MSLIAPILHITSTPGICGGKPHIVGHHITVQDVVIWHERLGQSADVIASEYDLALSDVYAALSYYFDNRADIDDSISAGDSFIASMRENSSSKILSRLS